MADHLRLAKRLANRSNGLFAKAQTLHTTAIGVLDRGIEADKDDLNRLAHRVADAAAQRDKHQAAADKLQEFVV